MNVSNHMLNTSLPWHLHTGSINRLFLPCSKESLFKVRFVLRCFQHLSLKAWLPGLLCRITGKLEASKSQFLSYYDFLPFRLPTFPVDIKQTASQRSEPSSRSLLMGEHPHPWQLLHCQDRKSRHRSSKPRRRSVLNTRSIT